MWYLSSFTKPLWSFLMFVTIRAVLALLSFLFGALGQSAIPPSTFPDASTPSSTGPTSTSLVINGSASPNSSSSRSVSGTMSVNSTSTVLFPPLNTVSPCGVSPPWNRHSEQDSLMLLATWLLYSVKLPGDGYFNGWMFKRGWCELFLSNVCMSSTITNKLSSFQQ